jgi:hypothetical protein
MPELRRQRSSTVWLGQQPANLVDQSLGIERQRQERPCNALRMVAMFCSRSKQDFDIRLLGHEHAGQGNVVHIAESEIHPGDQQAHSGMIGGVDRIQCRHRIFERNQLMAGRSEGGQSNWRVSASSSTTITRASMSAA